MRCQSCQTSPNHDRQKPIWEPQQALNEGLKCLAIFLHKLICLIKILSTPITQRTGRFLQKALRRGQLWAQGLIKARFLFYFRARSCQSSSHQAHRFISDPDTDSCYITAANPRVTWIYTHPCANTQNNMASSAHTHKDTHSTHSPQAESGEADGTREEGPVQAAECKWPT